MKILGYEFKIYQDGTVDSINAMGRFHSKSQRIQIATDLCPQQIESTVLHEVIEAINYYLHLQLSEQVVSSLEASLYQVMVDNNVSLGALVEGLENDGENRSLS